MPKSLMRTLRNVLIACGAFGLALLNGFIGHFFVSADTPAKIPADAPGFTAYVAGQIHKAIPDDTVEIADPLRLRVKSPRGGWGAVLDTVFNLCSRDRAGCANAIATYVMDMSTTYETAAPPPDRSLLRVVVRPSDYVESIRSQGHSHPLAVPLQGDLWMIGVFDLPRAISLLDESALVNLHLTAAEAFAIGSRT